jgi:hypothetical protein
MHEVVANVGQALPPATEPNPPKFPVRQPEEAAL